VESNVTVRFSPGSQFPTNVSPLPSLPITALLPVVVPVTIASRATSSPTFRRVAVTSPLPPTCASVSVSRIANRAPSSTTIVTSKRSIPR